MANDLIDRRSAMRRMVYLATAGLSVVRLNSQERPLSAHLPDGIGTEPDYDGSLPTPASVLGREKAHDPEIEIAKQIIAKAPNDSRSTPYDVARYFLKVGDGTYGDAWRPYVQGWPVRWNPVIVTFFDATKTVPEGDVTSWCAAFVNWCFQRAQKGVATDSASSGSFRSFSSLTTTPKIGDIVVFQRTHPMTQVEEHQGHVGFFVADHGNKVEVLGGNQIVGQERSHMICSRLFAKKSDLLTLNSYRTDPRLH
jgi:uncharacterized protein (TIGR02594 family)